MNWRYLRKCPWLDTRSRFVASTSKAGSILDLGSSDGETLSHIAQLRPDLKFFSVDIAGEPENYPAGCDFQRADLERDKLRWADQSMDSITCMQLIEHLNDLSNLLIETRRLLKPGGKIFFETPHPKTLALSSPSGVAAGTFTLNFYDDLTHTRIVSMGALAARLRMLGMEVLDAGISRNWLFAAAYPLLLLASPSRKKFTARAHWLGWSAYLVARVVPP
jgi:SAM-dependent methyltransferase